MCLSAARAYMALSSLNGSQAFSIFHPSVFQRALDSMRLVYRLLILDGFRGTGLGTTTKAFKFKSKGKRNAIRKQKEQSSCIERTVIELSADDRSQFKMLLFDTTESFFVLLNKVSLSQYNIILMNVTDLLRDFLIIDLSDQVLVGKIRRLSEFQQLNKISNRSFALMHRLIDCRHCAAQILFCRIAMPRILYYTFENMVLPSGTHPSKTMIEHKNAIVRFLKCRIQENMKDELDALLIILKTVCYRCPDRLDYRTKVANVLMEILILLPVSYHHDFANFLRIFGSYAKIFCRAFAVEIASIFLQQIDFTGSEQNMINNYMACDELINKCELENQRDQTLPSFVNDEEDKLEEERKNNVSRQKEFSVKKNVGFNIKSNLLPAKSFEPRSALLTFLLQACMDKAPTIAVELKNENFDVFEEKTNTALLNLIICRCEDERVSSRKTAISALEALFPYLSKEDSFFAIQCFKDRCRDLSLVVRKQAAESLSRLFASSATTTDILDEVWLTAVLPLVIDREQSVSQCACELIFNIVILPILNNSDIAMRILKIVEQKANYRRFIIRVLSQQSNEGKLTRDFAEALLSRYGDHVEKCVIWMLLKDLSTIFKINCNFAVKAWFELEEDHESNVVAYIAHVLARCGKELNINERRKLKDDISKKLLGFRIHESFLSTVYFAFSQILKEDDEDLSNCKNFLEFNRSFLDNCYQCLHSTIYRSNEYVSDLLSSQNGPDNKSIQRLVRIIVSIGEAMQYDSSLINNKIFDLLQLIIASDTIYQQMSQSIKTISSHCIDNINYKEKCLTQYSSRREANDKEEATFKIRQASNDHLPGSQKFSQGTAISLPGSIQCSVNMEALTSSVRAYAILALGKMCILDENLAKICIPVFAKQLTINPDHIIRNNIICVMCDLFMRFALLVDCHAAVVASCLKDSSTFIRKQILMLLTKLIKEQFIRWEGQIMYHFVSTLLDENEEIRNYAEMFQIDVLLVQFPSMFVNHFIECIFYFNSVVHGSWITINKALDEDVEQRNLKCALSGAKNKVARMKLYKFMMKTFDDQNKFTVMVRIGQEVYLAVVDGVLDFNDRKIQMLLVDCNEIMCSNEIKLSMNLGQCNSKTDDDDEPPLAVQDVAKKIVSSAFRRGIIEAILPHIIQLKYFLQEYKQPELEKGIIFVLRELCKDHREQLDEFLASDRQLMAEIQFDLKKLEEEEKNKRLTVSKINDINPHKVKSQANEVPSNNSINNNVELIPVSASICSQNQKSAIKEINSDEYNVSIVAKQTAFMSSGTDGDRNSSNPSALMHNNESYRTAKNVSISAANVANVQNKNNEKRIEVDRAEEDRADNISKKTLLDPEDVISKKTNIATRAISTPERTFAELTFRFADVSIIQKTGPSSDNK
ncbi:unnamed protein product [Dracunculus medinensis]|uniref:Cnd1 domain-containing protein n=1 Tax=Dracunculus medinensis TaxID=318479 RepID=A0A0N4UK94_DRAME|nr:unnamed protein product [Dracunculus medinensis]